MRFPHSVVISLSLAAGSLQAQWAETSGPFGGTVLSLASAGNDIIAATDGGGVFVMRNGVSNWQNGVWVRENDGMISLNAGSLGVGEQFVFVGTDSGICRSSLTSPLSWTPFSSGLPSTFITAIIVSGSEILTSTIGHGIYKSSNDGSGWTPINDGLASLNVRSLFVYGDTLLAGVDSGVCLSEDQGITWNTRNDGLPQSVQVWSLAVKDSFVFAGTRRFGVHRAEIDSFQWIDRNDGLPLQPQPIRAFAVISATVLAGSGNGVYKSATNGDSWQLTTAGLDNSAIKDLEQIGGLLAAGADGGAFFSTNNGSNWTERSAGMNATLVRDFVSDGSWLFAATRSGIYRSSDNGVNWQKMNDSLLNTRVTSLELSGSFLFAGTTDPGEVYRSSDEGGTWVRKSDSTLFAGNAIYDLEVSSGTLLAAGKGRIFITSDNGDSWTFEELDSLRINTLKVSGSEIFAGTNGGGVRRSVDLGKYWDPNGVGLGDSVITALQVSGGLVFAGTATAGVYVTSNSGISWEAANAGIEETYVNALLMATSDLFVGTSANGAFRSTDNGESWLPFNDGLNNLNVLSLALVDSTLLAGTRGSGVLQRSLPPEMSAPASPADQATDLNPPVIFTWTNAAGATRYHLQVALDSLFTVRAFDDSTVSGTSVEVDELSYNTEFFWRVRAIGTGGSSAFSLPRSFSTTSTLTYDNQLVHVFPTAEAQPTDYRLLGFPASVAVGDVFPGADGPDYKVFADNGHDPPNHLDRLSASSVMDPGNGYWALGRGTLSFSREVTMPQLNGSGQYMVPLDTGWNIISVPFDRPPRVDDVLLANGDSSGVFFQYLGVQNFSDTVTILAPFRGYYYDNRLDLPELKIPYPFPATSTTIDRESGIAWKLQVILESGGTSDASNFIGISPGPTGRPDQFSMREPPQIAEQPGLSFIRSGSRYRYVADFRPEIGAGQQWTVEVSTGDLPIHSIVVEGFEGIPETYRVELLDHSRSVRTDLRGTNRYEFSSVSGIMTFSILVGTEEFIDKESEDLIPDRFYLDQNYPNPFNPSTSISYGLPAESRVRLEVFSILGEHVVTLINRAQPAGRYTASWNGLNSAGHSVSSGIYFYRLLTNGEPMPVRKMLLVR